jgi:hypothetical protein
MVKQVRDRVVDRLCHNHVIIVQHQHDIGGQTAQAVDQRCDDGFEWRAMTRLEV